MAYVASLLLVPACGQSLNKAPPTVNEDLAGTTTTGGGKDFAMADAAPSAIIDMVGFNQAGAPTIVITSPAAGAEIHGDTMTVTATITSPSNSLIQASSVEVTVTPPGGAVSTAPLTLTTTANVYSGTVSLPDDSSGDRTFVISASDVNGLKGSAQGTFVHDHGPVLSFIAPSGATPVSGTQTISVEFTVVDTLHPISDLTTVTAGIRKLGDITLQAVPNSSPFTVFAMVDLKSFGSPALTGNQILKAQATNSAGTIGYGQQPFVIDNTGPGITISSPTPAFSFVSGVVTISADVTDTQSNIDDSTVVAVWGGNAAQFAVPLTKTSGVGTPGMKGTYTGTFDVRIIGTFFVQPTLSVRASDVLGNQSETVESFFVDNTRPWVSMDSTLEVRAAQLDVTKESCSALFSPLGIDVVTEQTAVPLAITLRARVEDQGNTESGLKVQHVSGIDTDLSAAAVVMYVIQDDGKTPLAVDTDGDTICDDVNPELVPTTDILLPGESLAIPLTPIAGTGAPDQTPTGAPASGICAEFGASSFGPYTGLGICDDTPLAYNIGTITAEPEIFTLPPVASGGVTCVGTQLDSQNHNFRGPICVVTRAVDNSGNINVSYPLHLCVIDPANPNNCNGYAGETGISPHCTGVYDKVAQQLGTGTCTAPASSGTNKGTFANGDIIEQLN